MEKLCWEMFCILCHVISFAMSRMQWFFENIIFHCSKAGIVHAMHDSEMHGRLSSMYSSRPGSTVASVPEFHFSTNHDNAILFDLKTVHQATPPKPRNGVDKWDIHHVKMPCSTWSTYTSSSFMGNDKSRWESIKSAFKKKYIDDSQKLQKAIMKYNPTKNEWTFVAMHHFYTHHLTKLEAERFFKNTLPGIIELALKLPELVRAPIPLLKKGQNKTVSLTQQQVASLLANAFLCTFPNRNNQNFGEYKNFPRINFTGLYEAYNLEIAAQKMRCIIHYFERVLRSMPTGVLSFTRRRVSGRDCPRWDKCEARVADLPLYVDDKLKIEDAHGLIQVDFANKMIGGGVLGNGCVQEEIRFMICPELIVSMLFTEELDDNEALIIIGCERYSRYNGYGSHDFRFAGDYEDMTLVDNFGRKRCAVLAIDATVYYSERPQYQRLNLIRELNKAWIGFSWGADPSGLSYPGVAGGKWGCGAFGGCARLKLVLQALAAAAARRPLALLTFHDAELAASMRRLHAAVQGSHVTVGQVYKLITEYYNLVGRGDNDLHSYLEAQICNRMTSYDSDDSMNGSKEMNSSTENEGYQDATGGSDESMPVLNMTHNPWKEPTSTNLLNIPTGSYSHGFGDDYSQRKDRVVTEVTNSYLPSRHHGSRTNLNQGEYNVETGSSSHHYGSRTNVNQGEHNTDTGSAINRPGSRTNLNQGEHNTDIGSAINRPGSRTNLNQGEYNVERGQHHQNGSVSNHAFPINYQYFRSTNLEPVHHSATSNDYRHYGGSSRPNVDNQESSTYNRQRANSYGNAASSANFMRPPTNHPATYAQKAATPLFPSQTPVSDRIQKYNNLDYKSPSELSKEFKIRDQSSQGIKDLLSDHTTTYNAQTGTLRHRKSYYGGFD